MSLPNETRPSENLICSAQPSKSQFEEVAKQGATVAVSLRPHNEYQGRDVAGEVESAGMKYFNIPISDPSGFTKENAQKLKDIIDNAEGKVLLFCGSSNRVGALLAMKAFFFDGKNPDEALAFGESAGLTALRSAVWKILQHISKS